MIVVFNVDYLNELRIVEMERLLHSFPPGARILEFGAGTGRQARFLSDRGFDVVAIDLPDSSYAKQLVFPVMQYDGQHIPLDDQSIDVIFSSNVLEHVENIPTIMAEFRRILRPSGFGLHVMPTPCWRLWTFLSGAANATVAAARIPKDLIHPPDKIGRWASLARNMRAIVAGVIPLGHGIAPEGISELWTFSRHAWVRKFRRNGFDVIQNWPMGLFYTGHMLLGKRLSFTRRQKLGRLLGSATQIYLVRARETGVGRH